MKHNICKQVARVSRSETRGDVANGTRVSLRSARATVEFRMDYIA